VIRQSPREFDQSRLVGNRQQGAGNLACGHGGLRDASRS
jgi:hypothetical protein